MSFLVSLPRETYPDGALDGFTITSDFTLQNAQAMMWLSQLAYETDDPEKVDKILKAWKLERRAFGPDAPGTSLVPPKARFIVAVGRGATFVTFSGTDPLSIKDWLTDFTLAPRLNALHEGFRAAVAAVQSEIERAIKGSDAAGLPLFFTGHSMGGGLANISAMRALEAKLQATAVYTFGGARAGSQRFFDDYKPLGDLTFRLVHGDDIVAAVPPDFAGFRHVGRMLHCPHRSTFAGQALAPKDGNNPSLILVALNTVRDIVLGMPSIEKLLQLNIDPRRLDQLEALPIMVRDHVPASYFRALQMPLA